MKHRSYNDLLTLREDGTIPCVSEVEWQRIATAWIELDELERT